NGWSSTGRRTPQAVRCRQSPLRARPGIGCSSACPPPAVRRSKAGLRFPWLLLVAILARALTGSTQSLPSRRWRRRRAPVARPGGVPPWPEVLACPPVRGRAILYGFLFGHAKNIVARELADQIGMT